MRAFRRYENAPQHPDALAHLNPNNPAILEGRSVYQASVVNAADAPRILVDGINQRKIGNRVVKGAWKGMRIFTLTLEERKTCPTSCHIYERCYGNNMAFARRLTVDHTFLRRLDDELRSLQRRYPKGFVIRLHVLGDFYSADYVERWRDWLDRLPALRVFGYTAWPPESAIGGAVAALRDAQWTRFAVRTSNAEPGPMQAAPLGSGAGIHCPAQTNKTSCCGTCALCWAPAARDRAILFAEHGRAKRHGVGLATGLSRFYTPVSTRPEPGDGASRPARGRTQPRHAAARPAAEPPIPGLRSPPFKAPRI